MWYRSARLRVSSTRSGRVALGSSQSNTSCWTSFTPRRPTVWHQQALREGQFNVVRCGTKENPSDLGTKVLEKEAMASCMSKLALVPAGTLRSAIVAALTRVTSGSNDVMMDGCCSTRVGDTTAGVVNTADSVSTFVASVGAGGAVVVMMLVWRAALSKYGGWNRQTRSSAEAQSSAREQTLSSAHRWSDKEYLTTGVLHRSRTRACLPGEHKKCCVRRRKRGLQ